MAKQSTYSPKNVCQHHVVQADSTSKIITFDRKVGDTLTVNKGVIVSKHFNPLDPSAKADRAAQLEAPENFVKSSGDAILLAELLHVKGWFKSVNEAMADIMDAQDEAIKSPADLDDELLNKQLEEVCKENTVPEMKALLKEAGIAYHGRAKERSLALKCVEADLL